MAIPTRKTGRGIGFAARFDSPSSAPTLGLHVIDSARDCTPQTSRLQIAERNEMIRRGRWGRSHPARADGEGAMGDSASSWGICHWRVHDDLPHTPCFGRKGQGQPRPRSEDRCGTHIHRGFVANENSTPHRLEVAAHASKFARLLPPVLGPWVAGCPHVADSSRRIDSSAFRRMEAPIFDSTCGPVRRSHSIISSIDLS